MVSVSLMKIVRFWNLCRYRLWDWSRASRDSYISRQHIFEEFSKILGTKGVEADKRADVLNLSSLLVIDLLQGPKKAKKAEVRGALEVLLPSTVQLLGTTDQSVQQSAVKVLQTCLDKKNSPQVEALLVDHLVHLNYNKYIPRPSSKKLDRFTSSNSYSSFVKWHSFLDLSP